LLIHLWLNVQAKMLSKQQTLPAFVLCALVVCAVVYFSHEDQTTSLMQIDGITLDANAMAQLGGGSSGSESSQSSPNYVTVSHESSKHMNQLLKKEEKGSFDGIALDSRAAAEFGDAQVHIKHRHDIHRAASHKLRVSKAQRMLDAGKQDLDSNNWADAVKRFSMAESMWKKDGNADYHWAQSLKKDVLRAHPEAGADEHSPHVLSAHQQAIKDAEKQLSSGHAFRSLYGLLREQHAPAGHQRSQHAGLSSKSSSAKTTALSQAVSKSAVASLSKSIDDATKAALRRLEARNKVVLKREEEALIDKAEEDKDNGVEALQRQQLRAATPQQQTSSSSSSKQAPADGKAKANPGALEVWNSADAPPPATSLTWNTAQGPSPPALAAPARYQSLSEVPSSMRVVAPVQQPQQQQQEKQPQPQPQLRSQQQQLQQQQQGRGAVYQALTGVPQQQGMSQLQQKQGVPVINLNLPAGQRVPAGRYAMDGNLVEDVRGHWDFVGNLVPTGLQEVAQ